MNPQNVRPQAAYQESIFFSVFICILIIFYFLQTSEQFFHWFVIPVTLSGIIISIDAIDWFRGRLQLFDPVGILGLLGFHFFFLAPLLHVSWDSWLEPWFPYPPDWRPWLGGMAIFNLLGIVVYRFFKKVGSRNTKNQSVQIWRLDYKRLPLILPFFLMLSAVLQTMVYRQFGGIANYIASATTEGGGDAEQFNGLGIVFLFSETFPILAMLGFAAYARKNKRMQTWPVLLLVLIIFLVLTLFFGGLRGSRSNTIWALFWATGIINFWIRPISKKQIAIGLVFLVLFMYFYGFFKSYGFEGVQKAFQGQEARASLEKESGRTWQGLLLDDLGRSDIHALLLYQMMRHDSNYEYAWGRTYFAAFTILIPKQIMPNRPPTKVKEGTDASYGKNSYIPGEWQSSKVYGLAGEAMLNFGPFAIPFAFIPLGLFVGRVQRLLYTWEASDTRSGLIPMLVNLCFIILVGDLDNDIFFIFKNSSLPSVFIFLVSQNHSAVLDSNQAIVNRFYHPLISSKTNKK